MEIEVPWDNQLLATLSGLFRTLLRVEAARQGFNPHRPPAGAKSTLAIPGLQPQVARLLGYIIDPQTHPFADPPPSTPELYVETVRKWKQALRFWGIPDLALPFPYQPSIDFVRALTSISPNLQLTYARDMVRYLEFGRSNRGDGGGGFAAWVDEEDGGGDDGGGGVADPYLGLWSWSDPAAAEMWPAGSIDVSRPDVRQALLTPFAPRRGALDTLGAPAPTPTPRAEHVAHSDSLPWGERLPPPLRDGDIPWFSRTKRDGMVLAGGAVTSLLHPGTQPRDFHLFCVVSRTDACGRLREADDRLGIARRLCAETAAALRPPADAYAMNSSLMKLRVLRGSDRRTDVAEAYVFSPGAPQTVLDLGEFPAPGSATKVRLVCRAYASPAHVVHGFDLDAGAVLYDGEAVHAMERALRAVHTGVMVPEPWRQSPSFEYRLFKYSQRYGFKVLLPGCGPLVRSQLADMRRRLLEHKRANSRSTGLTATIAGTWVEESEGAEKLLAMFCLARQGLDVQGALDENGTGGQFRDNPWELLQRMEQLISWTAGAWSLPLRYKLCLGEFGTVSESGAVCFPDMPEVSLCETFAQLGFLGSDVEARSGQVGQLSGSNEREPLLQRNWYKGILAKLSSSSEGV